MNDAMKKILSQASSFGAPISYSPEFKEAVANGWLGPMILGQNTTTWRRHITPEGAKALEAAA